MKRYAVLFLAWFGAVMIPVVLLSAFNTPTVKTVFVDRVVTQTQYVNMNVVLHGLSVNTVINFVRDNPAEFEKVLWFYDQLTHNRQITQIIVDAALLHNVPMNLSFAMGKQESGFDPKAYNHNPNGTWDRGLFQLNSGDHPKWSVADFYNPVRNAEEAMSEFEELLGSQKSMVVDSALVAYNAGRNSMKNQRIPFITALHVFRVRDFERAYDLAFCKTLVPLLNLNGLDLKTLD